MRWLLWGVAALVGLVLLAVAAVTMVPTERVARLAADRIAAATGRAVEVQGPVRARLRPLGVRLEDVVVANAPWSAEGPMLRADAVEVSVPWRTLFGGGAGIDALTLEGARLLLERREDGLANWQDAPDAPAGAAAPAPAAEPAEPAAPGPDGPAIGRLALRDAEVTWIDRAAGRRVDLREAALDAAFDGPGLPATLAATGRAGALAVAVDARRMARGAGAPVALSVEAEGGGTRVRLDGAAGLGAATFEGRVEARSDDGFAPLAALGLDTGGWPDGALTARLELAADGAIRLREMVAERGPNRLAGTLEIDRTGPRPRLRADLSAEALDLTGGEAPAAAASPSAPPPAPGAAPADAVAPPPPSAPGGGWSGAPLDASALLAVDGEIALATGPVSFEGGRVDALHARLALESGRAVLSLDPLTAYGGTVTGTVVVDAGGGPSARATLDGRGLQAGPLLTDLAGLDRLAGAADLSVDLSAAGASVAAMVASLEGLASLRMGPGEVAGLDLAAMIRTLDPGQRGEGYATAFDSLSLSATVAGGVVRSDDLAFSAPPFLDATGAGSADLGARTISYRLLPTLRSEAAGGGLTLPVSIEGPWADPAIRPDLEGLVRERLEADPAEAAARLRDEADLARALAEDALRHRLAEELEVVPEALGSRQGLEDALRERLQDRLLDLLQGR